jgi:hypothetical protein
MVWIHVVTHGTVRKTRRRTHARMA